MSVCVRLCVIVLSCVLLQVHATITLPTIFSSNMVLQRSPESARVWGFATDQETVTVSVAGQTYTAQAVDGWWAVDLDPVEAGGPYDLIIAGKTNSIHLTNVMFGDVWICSGQSNMQMCVIQTFGAEDAIKDSNNYPNIRVFSVKEVTADAPQYDLPCDNKFLWAAASNVTINGSAWDYFSATCYYFGRDTYRANPTVPIGLIATDWGGTYVQAWSSPDALAKCNGSTEAVPVENPVASDPSLYQVSVGDDPNRPSVLWNAMIHPLLNMSVKGAVWYQGEANANDPKGYACMFPAMIADWRLKFGLQFPFCFVQLAAYPDGDNQYAAIRQLHDVGMATAIDLGDPNSPDGSIHPRNKSEVGRRLSLQAQSIAYGMKVVSNGPYLSTFTVVPTGTANDWVVTMNFLSSGPVVITGSQSCTQCCGEPFSAVTSTGKQVMGKAQALGTAIAVTFSLDADGSKPLAVQYAWADYPQCVVYDSLSDLVAPPFIQDLW